MKIDKAGQEYATFSVQGALGSMGTAEVSFDNKVTWHPMTWAAGKTSVKVLVCGPACTSKDPSAVILALGTNIPVIKVTDSPEVVIRTSGGTIDVT